MRTIYFDCFSGASGDMLLGALVDLGVDLASVRAELKKLQLDGYRLESRRVERSALSATKVDVIVGENVEGPGGRVHRHGHTVSQDRHHNHEHNHEHGHEHSKDHSHDHSHAQDSGRPSMNLTRILDVIASSSLSEKTRQRAADAFRRLGDAEARAHGTTPEDVHFHEVGAVDAIVDVVATMVAFELLGIERFCSSPLNVGGGTVTFSHGTYPVPGPATLELLRGVPIYSGAVKKELVTPTGAAILTSVVEYWGPLFAFVVDRVGYGAGTRDVQGHPNVLRVMLGTTSEEESVPGSVVVLEAAIDDMTPEATGYFLERALAAGALDVYVTPIQMKKNRPGVLLTLLAEPVDRERFSRLLFQETTTIGLRYREVARTVLDRQCVSVETAVGPIHVKVAKLDGDVVSASPEFEDCREAAIRTGLPVRRIQAMAAAAFAGRNE